MDHAWKSVVNPNFTILLFFRRRRRKKEISSELELFTLSNDYMLTLLELNDRKNERFQLISTLLEFMHSVLRSAHQAGRKAGREPTAAIGLYRGNRSD